MERSAQIWKFLKGSSAEEEDRRGAILDGLLKAFKEGGEDVATAYLAGKMTELEGDFKGALDKLDALLS